MNKKQSLKSSIQFSEVLLTTTKGELAKKPSTISHTEYGNTFGALAKRRHPNKNTSWVRKRYFKTINGNKWTFACNISDRQGKEKDLILYPIAYTPIERHIKVKGDASPDDPSLKEYWEKRHQKQGKSYWERNSRNYKVAQNQDWKCPSCGKPLFNGEEIETHHI